MNCLPLDTVVTLFLFIQCSVPIYSFIYLFIYLRVIILIYLFIYLFTAEYRFLFIYRRSHRTASQSHLDYRLGTEPLSGLNSKMGEWKDRGTERRDIGMG